MPIEFVGKSIELGGGASGSLTLSYSRDATIVEIMVNSKDRVQVTGLKIVGVEEFITGVLELDLLKKHGNVYELPETIAYPKESKIEIGLKELSGSANTVYIGFVMVY